MNNQNKLTNRANVKKAPAGAPPSIITTKIDVRPFNRKEQDIPNWRSAIRSAESRIPRRQLLYDLYADVELDAHVESVTGKRIDPVTLANWQFVDKEGQPVDEINELIDSIGFDDMLKEIIKSKFWGYSMLEPRFYKDVDGTWEMSTYLTPRLNMRPEIGVIAYSITGDEGINVREGYYSKTIMEVGSPQDLGLYMKAAPFQILKRGGVGDWAMFVQVFGNPLVDATWDGFDEEQRTKLLKAIDDLGAGGALVRPEGTTVTLLENKSNANGDLQDKFMSFLDKQISKALLGSTETTESSTSSGYAQAKVHEGQDEIKHEADLTFTRKVLNSRFIKILQTHGFDTKGGKFIIQGESNELTTKESYDIHKSLKTDVKLPIANKFWYETYGVPEPEEGDDIGTMLEPPEEKEVKKDAPKKKAATDKKAKEEEEVSLSDSRGAIADYFSRMLRFFQSAPVQKTEAGAEVTTCCGEAPTINLKADPEPAFNSLLKAVTKAQGKGFIYTDLVDHIINTLTEAFQLGWEGKPLVQLMDLGFNYGTTDPKMQTAWELNLFRFSTVKAAYQSAEVNKLFHKSRNFAEFERAVKKAYGYKYKSWLISEYNTAYQVAESAQTYYRLQAQKEIFPYWEYRTIGDGRVRDSHRILHGKILPADHALWRKIFPPNGWGCRCYVVPRMAHEVDQAKVNEDIAFVEDYVKNNPEYKKTKRQGFAINRADIREVFTDSQSYSSDPGKTLKQAGMLTAQDWDMPPIETAQEKRGKSTYQESKDRQIITDFWNHHKVDEKELSITDYASRPLSLSKQALNNLTKDNQKHWLLNALPEIIKDPDEVWVNDLTGEAFDTYLYLKYYRGQTLRVVARLSKEGDLTISDWLPNTREKHRRGLPVRK